MRLRAIALAVLLGAGSSLAYAHSGAAVLWLTRPHMHAIPDWRAALVGLVLVYGTSLALVCSLYRDPERAS